LVSRKNTVLVGIQEKHSTGWYPEKTQYWLVSRKNAVLVGIQKKTQYWLVCRKNTVLVGIQKKENVALQSH